MVNGIPQGGVRSPLLFSIFINKITKNFSCQYHLYADDLQLYIFFFIILIFLFQLPYDIVYIFYVLNRFF